MPVPSIRRAIGLHAQRLLDSPSPDLPRTASLEVMLQLIAEGTDTMKTLRLRWTIPFLMLLFASLSCAVLAIKIQTRQTAENPV